MRTIFTWVASAALALCLTLAPVSVSAWGERGSAGMLTGVDTSPAQIWIDFDLYMVDERTQLFGPTGHKATIESLERHLEQEVTYVVRDNDSGPTLIVLRVHKLIED